MYYFKNLINNIANEQPLAPEINESDRNIIINTPRNLGEIEHKQITENSLIETKPKIFDRIIDHTDVLAVVNRICNEIYERDPKQIEYVESMAEIRKIDPKVLLENKCFFCPNPHYMEQLFADLGVYRQDYHITTAENTLWKDRFIIPIRDFKGNVYGFVGYSQFSSAKYVEWSALTYKLSTIKALGLNNLESILESGYCIFTEGVFDYFRAIQNGLPVIANLGVSFNKLLRLLTERLDVVFCAYDSDEAGRKNVHTIKELHGNVYDIRFKSIVGINDKGEKYIKKVDMDDSLKEMVNVVKLKKNIQLRLNHPFVRMKDIVI